MKKYGKRLCLGILLAGLAVVCVLLFLKKQNGKDQGRAGMGMGPGQGQQGAAQQAEADIVSAEVPTRGNIYITTGLTGTLESSDVVYVYAKASGDVTDVKVKAGDMVEAGQVLFKIDTDQVDAAKNSLDSAAVSLSEAQSNLNRMKILYDGGDLSEQEYEQYTNKVRSAELQYNSAKLAYNKQVEYSTVTAPIAGRIESCDTEVFDRVSANSELCVISGEGNKKITFYVTQRMLENLNEGDSITVEKNGKAYEAKISAVNSMVDSATGLFKIEAQMEETEEVATGMVVKLQVTTNKAEDAMLIPIDAVYYSGGEAYVYLYEDGTARTAKIEVGLTDSDCAEVLSGLSEDDLVIKTWSSNLYEGAKVRLNDGTGNEGQAGLKDGPEGNQADGPEGGPTDPAGGAADDPAGKEGEAPAEPGGKAAGLEG